MSELTIKKTESGFDALLVHGIGSMNDRVNYKFHDFYMSFSPVDRGGKYYIDIFDKNYVLQDIIITDKMVLINTMSTDHTIENLFTRMEDYARDHTNDVLEALVQATPSHSRVCMEAQ